MDVKTVKNFKFSDNITYGCGGIARRAFFPQNEDEAIYIFDKIRNNKEKYYILGNGSDVLAQDGFYNGDIIVTKDLNRIILLSDGNLYCESGVMVSQLLKFCIKQGLGGLEYLCGIPATLGGVCFMNAGATGKYISDNIESVTVYDGKKHILSAKDCNFSYKYSTMRDIKCIIIGCNLKVNKTFSHCVRENCIRYINQRAAIPKGKSCGCVFKNPPGKSAGSIIEAAGLKGIKIGDAQVNRKHANFIINNGLCSQDVYELIQYVKHTVYKKFAIKLEEEVCYIGDFK